MVDGSTYQNMYNKSHYCGRLNLSDKVEPGLILQSHLC